MEKRFFYSIAKSVVAIVVLAIVAVIVTSCDETVDELNYTVKQAGISSSVTTTITRDGDYGKVIATKNENGVPTDTTVIVYLGKVSFEIDRNDTTVVANNAVEHVGFSLGDATTTSYEVDGVYYTKSIKNFVDNYNKYSKKGSISYLDAYTYVWGKKCIFPSANGSVSYKSVATADNGSDKEYNYTLCTSSYEVTFMGNSQEEKQGLFTLATKADDKLTSTTLTDKGFEVLTFDEDGNPTTAKSWIEVTRNYSVSGPVTSKYEVIMNSKVSAPAYEIRTVSTFDMSKVNAQVSESDETGTRTEGNITISQHTKSVTVGNSQFTKLFTLTHETAVWSDGNNTFEMPSACFESVTDNGYTNEEMADLDEYERVRNTHKISSTYAGYPVVAKAETEMRIIAPSDELVNSYISDEGFDYVDDNTSNTWLEITEVWSVSGTKTYRKSVALNNSITLPAHVVKIVNSFDLTQVGAVQGEAVLVGTTTKGEFKVETYELAYTVGNDSFTRIFYLTFEKATYLPLLDHEMIWKNWESFSDKGFTNDESDNQTQDGVEYNARNYTHKMSANFNGKTHTASATALLLKKAPVSESRETPSWLGAPVSAKYTRVQKTTGDKFMDMIVFTFENGVVMAPNGNVDMKLIYAFDASVASANGVDRCVSTASYTGVWTGSKWAPAKVTIQSGRWIYAGVNSAWTHTVMANEAIILGIGEDVTPTPSAQSVSVKGNTITITYAKNNGSKTANTSLSIR